MLWIPLISIGETGIGRPSTWLILQLSSVPYFSFQLSERTLDADTPAGYLHTGKTYSCFIFGYHFGYLPRGFKTKLSMKFELGPGTSFERPSLFSRGRPFWALPRKRGMNIY